MATDVVLSEGRSDKWNGEDDALFQVIVCIFVSIWVGGFVEVGLDAFQEALTIAPQSSGAIGKWYGVIV